MLRDPVGTLGAGLLLPFVQWRLPRSVAISEADHEIAVRGYRQTWYGAGRSKTPVRAGVQYETQGERLVEALAAAQTSERLMEVRYRAGATALKTWLTRRRHDARPKTTWRKTV